MAKSISIKNKGGRPSKFKSESDLKKKIQEYFDWAIANNKPLTIERLSIFLDVERHYLSSNDDRFSATIKRAVEIIHADKVERLHSQNNVTGIIFDLKNNHGWIDKKDVDAKVGFTFLDLARIAGEVEHDEEETET